MQRHLGNGYELDDDAERIDHEAVHRFLSSEAYWALGRTREVVDELIGGTARVVGLYQDGQQLGFVRIVSDRHTMAYVDDVYVLPDHRRRGLGGQMFRFAVEDGPFAGVRKWGLHTRDAHELYRRYGFDDPTGRYMERWNET